MAYETTFKRYELKYLLTLEQRDAVLQAMEPYMHLDKYGRTTIRNIYFDTEDYRLIRHSIEKPAYKEKLRLRSYRQAALDDPIFVELKKKYNSIVYKRRLAIPQQQALNWLSGDLSCSPSGQIAEEINYFATFYSTLRPTAFLSYEREAWFSLDGSDFRVTFDDTILCRQSAVSLNEKPWGDAILPEGKILMEIKTSRGIPLWMTQVLTQQRIFKTSFSKYGTAYKTLIFPELKGGHLHV